MTTTRLLTEEQNRSMRVSPPPPPPQQIFSTYIIDRGCPLQASRLRATRLNSSLRFHAVRDRVRSLFRHFQTTETRHHISRR